MKRSALKRKTPLRAKKQYRWKGRDAATRRADAMLASRVHARGRCALCQFIGVVSGDPLEVHHARGRLKGFRWREESCLLLCRFHHRTGTVISAHGAPAEFRRWLEKNRSDILLLPNVPETAEQAIARMELRG